MQTILVDITPGFRMPTIYYSQGDVGTQFAIDLRSRFGDSLPASPTVTIQATKPSGFGFSVAADSITNGVATFTMTSEMSDEAGRFPAELKVVKNSVTLFTANFYMQGEATTHPEGTTDGSQETVIPELTQLVERVEDAASSVLDMTVNATTLAAGSQATYSYDEDTNTATFGIPQGEAGAGAAGVVASAYSSSSTYAVGDYVIHNSNLYRCTTAITTAEAWTSGHWTQVALAPEVSDLKSDYNNKFGEFELLSNNLWVNQYGTVNNVKFTPNGHGGFKIKGTASADGTLRYTFPSPITLAGYRLQFVQTKNESDKLIVRCRNSSYTIVRNLAVSGLSGFSVDSSTTTIAHLDIVVLSGSVLDTELYVGLTETTAETKLYPPKIVNAYYAKYADYIDEPTVDIDFWGDSLTAGYGGNGSTYCNTCAVVLGASYRNNGHGGETANTIAARQGGNVWIMPSGSVNGTYTLADMNDVYGGKVTPLRQIANDVTAKTLYINGKTAMLTRTSQTDPSSDDIVYTVSGYTGSALTVPTPCRFIGSDYNAKITVIFVGTNGQTVGDVTDVDARIAIIDSMIAHLKNKNYIVMGLSNGNESTRAEDDAKMLAHYGNNFFPTRKELVKNGLAIENITPTADDLIYIASGTVPESLRIDATHLNQSGYVALGKLLAYKMYSLGYDKLIAK